MSDQNGSAAIIDADADELEGVYALLAEALSDIDADAPCDAASCIERAMGALGFAQ
jgi:hypothetical protein